MAGRFGRSLYRFSSVNRPVAPGSNTSDQDSAHPSASRETLVSPKRGSFPASPTYSVKKAAASPPSSPPSYRASTARVISSPPKPIDEYPNYKPTTQPRSPEAEPKSVVYKATEKVTKSDHHVESGKTASSHKQQPNAITIAGENLGAVMEIVESKREGGHVIKKKETIRGMLNSIGNDQNNEDSKDHKAEGQKALNSLPASTFLNGNFQSVNNSLLYGASLAHRDPGLHLSFSRNPTGDRFTVDDKKQQHKKY